MAPCDPGYTCVTALRSAGHTQPSERSQASALGCSSSAEDECSKARLVARKASIQRRPVGSGGALFLLCVLALTAFPVTTVHASFFGNVDSDANLTKAVNAASLNGNMVLIAVSGAPKHLVTALNVIHQLRAKRQDNVFLLTGQEKDCHFMHRQSIVTVRMCAWSDALREPEDWWLLSKGQHKGARRIWFLRQMFFTRILRAQTRTSLLMTDTDVCFQEDPFRFFEAFGPNLTVALNGNWDGLNIGIVYAQKTASSPPGDFEYFDEVSRRLTAFREAGRNSTRVQGRNEQVMWDQAVVNDVYQQYVTGQPCYLRSCWLGFGRHNDTEGGCFSECCSSGHPLGAPPGSRDDPGSLAWIIKRDLQPLVQGWTGVWHSNTHKRIGTGFSSRAGLAIPAHIGHCGDRSPLWHENQCTRKPGDGLPKRGHKIEWARHIGCWHSPLDSLLEEKQLPSPAT